MKELLAYLLLLAYVVVSIASSVSLYSKDGLYYSKQQKRIHLALIWLVPFIWSWLLAGMRHRLPGSQYYDKTKISLGHKSDHEVDTMG